MRYLLMAFLLFGLLAALSSPSRANGYGINAAIAGAGAKANSNAAGGSGTSSSGDNTFVAIPGAPSAIGRLNHKCGVQGAVSTPIVSWTDTEFEQFCMLVWQKSIVCEDAKSNAEMQELNQYCRQLMLNIAKYMFNENMMATYVSETE